MTPTPTVADALVLFGATGFTGGLTAAYLAQHSPDGLRWGLAGRNLAKLEQVRDALGEAGAGVELIVADSGDPVALADLAARTQVVLGLISAGSPFLLGALADRYGLVAGFALEPALIGLCVLLLWAGRRMVTSRPAI